MRLPAARPCLYALGLGLALSGCHEAPPAAKSDWPVYLGDLSRSHYSELDQINRQNVKQLQVAWSYHTGDADTGGLSQIQCSPIVRAGRLYGTSPRLKLFCLEASTGKPIWVFDPYQGKASSDVQLNANRGVSYWSSPEGDDRLFYVAGSFLYAVNARTGRPVPDFGDSGKIDLHDDLDRQVSRLFVTATSPGVIYKDLLILGTRVAEDGQAAPGYIRAYEVRTGKRKWIFHTIPRPGEYGYDTWENPDAWKTVGGVNSWAGMSLDEKRGVVYVPTGSATPDFYGGLRRGRDLFANCLLAIDAGTGKLRWYYQVVHHDLWDRDLPAPPNLVTLTIHGKKRDAVAQVTKRDCYSSWTATAESRSFPSGRYRYPTLPGFQARCPGPPSRSPRPPSRLCPRPFRHRRLIPISLILPDRPWRKCWRISGWVRST